MFSCSLNIIFNRLLVAGLVVGIGVVAGGCDDDPVEPEVESTVNFGTYTTNFSSGFSMSQQQVVSFAGVDSAGFVQAVSEIDFYTSYDCPPHGPGEDPGPCTYRLLGSPVVEFEDFGPIVAVHIVPDPDYSAIMPLGGGDLDGLESVPELDFVPSFSTNSIDTLTSRIFAIQAQDGTFGAFSVESVDTVSDTTTITVNWMHQTSGDREF